MATSVSSCYSNSGAYLANSGFDGTLRVFECDSGVLKQEYTSSSHLSCTTTCMRWSKPRKNEAWTPKSKKRKLNKSASNEVLHDDLILIALGTTTGTVNLYSFAKGQLHTQLIGGHSMKVNDVEWHETQPELFSCSDDQYVVQWNLSNGKIKHKWKCDTSSVSALCQCSDSKLLTASHNIKVWDIETRTIVQSFIGHSSPIFKLCPVLAGAGESESTYVLSAATDDRHINVWSMGANERKSIASFSVPDEPVAIDLSKSTEPSHAIVLSVVTRKGAVYLFEQVLNGRKKKPVTCKCIVTAQVDEGSTVPIFASFVAGSRVSVAIGNPLMAQFETVIYDAAKPEITISVSSQNKFLTKSEYSNVKKVSVSKYANTLTPSDMMPIKSSRNRERSRKRSVSDISVEERLQAMDTETTTEATKPTRKQPVALTLSKLLQQGLLSQDKNILNSLFQEKSESVIRNTIKQLPLSFVVPLIESLENGIVLHAQSALNLCLWINALISCHSSYILSAPAVMNSVSKLHHSMMLRQKFYPKMLQLKGRLELMRQQQSQSPDADEEATSQPLLVHQDESDDNESDSMAIDGTAALDSDDEGWDEISDMDE